MPTVDDSFGVKMPWRSPPKRLSRFSDARFAVSRVAPAYWSDETMVMPGIRRLHLLEESLLALLGARGAFLIAEHEHLALAAEQRAEPFGARARRPCSCRSRRS